MKEKYIALFTGQGAQYTGMFDAYKDQEICCGVMEKASEVLEYNLLKISRDKKKIFQTQYSQPINYVYEYMLYQLFLERHGIVPGIMLGHSMGEFVALACSGAVDFETGLNIIKKRSGLMVGVEPFHTMVSVLGVSSAEVKVLVESYQSAKGAEAIISNYNGSSQTVVVVRKEDVDIFDEYVREEHCNATVKRLNLPYPFHTKYMKKFALQLKEYMSEIEFCRMQMPILSNATGKACNDSTIIKYLAEQMYTPVRFSDCMHYAVLSGGKQWVEFGPALVLGKMVKRDYAEAEVFLASEELHKKDNIIRNKTTMKKHIEQYLYDITTNPTKNRCINYSDITKNYDLLKKLYKSSAEFSEEDINKNLEQIFIKTMHLKGYDDGVY